MLRVWHHERSSECKSVPSCACKWLPSLGLRSALELLAHPYRNISLDGRLCHGAERRTDHAEKLAGLVGRRTTSGWKWLALVLDRLLYAGMRDVIVIAEFAERIPAALQLAIRTNQSSTVGALSHGG